jgi:hypothetical protein
MGSATKGQATVKRARSHVMILAALTELGSGSRLYKAVTATGGQLMGLGGEYFVSPGEGKPR